MSQSEKKTRNKYRAIFRRQQRFRSRPLDEQLRLLFGDLVKLKDSTDSKALEFFHAFDVPSAITSSCSYEPDDQFEVKPSPIETSSYDSDDSSTLPPLFSRTDPAMFSLSNDDSDSGNNLSTNADSDDGSSTLPGLDNRPLVDSSSDDDSLLPCLHDRKLVDSSSDDDTLPQRLRHKRNPPFVPTSSDDDGLIHPHGMVIASTAKHALVDTSSDDNGKISGKSAESCMVMDSCDKHPLVDTSSDDDGRITSHDLVNTSSHKKDNRVPGRLPSAPKFGSIRRRKVAHVSGNNLKQCQLNPNWHPCGLQNLGNTCFANSILQSLAYLTPLYECIRSFQPRLHYGDSTNTIASALQAVFSKLHSPHPSVTSIAPSEIISAFPSFGQSLIHENAPKFQVGRQEDAHEFLNSVLDQISRKCTTFLVTSFTHHRGSLTFNAFAAIPHSGSSGSCVKAMFRGEYKYTTTCHECKTSTVTNEAFQDIALSISSPSVRSLPAAWTATFQPEILTGANQFFCSHCRKHVDATRKQSVSSQPPFLWLYLKRFQTNMTGTVASKITKPIGFVETFKIPSPSVSDSNYTLHAVVNHHGSSPGGGHYTATIRNPILVQTGTEKNWLHFNDSQVQTQLKRDAFNFADAYLLLFVKTSIYDSIHSKQGINSSTSLPELQHPTTSLRHSLRTTKTKQRQGVADNCMDSTSSKTPQPTSRKKNSGTSHRQKRKQLSVWFDLEAQCSDSSSTKVSPSAQKRSQLQKKRVAVSTVTEDASDSEYTSEDSDSTDSSSPETQQSSESSSQTTLPPEETSPLLAAHANDDPSSSTPYLHWDLQIWGDELGATPSGISTMHGTSSYASSVFQYLAHIPAFAERIMTCTFASSPDNQGSSLQSTLALHLQNLFRQMHARDYPRIYPNELLQTLPRFGSNVKNGGPQFILGRREDAYAFLSAMLDRLNKQDDSGTGSATLAAMLDGVFNGVLAGKAQQCNNCGHSSETESQSFTSLHLPVDEKCLDVQGTLDEFLGSCHQQNVCQVCNTPCSEHSQRRHMAMLPTCLQLKLDRFTLQETQPGVYLPKKSTAPIAVNKTVKVSDVHGTTHSYLLCGMIIHDGSSDPNQGHYRAIVNDPIRPHAWFLKNDETVTSITAQQVHDLSLQTSYVLCYQKVSEQQHAHSLLHLPDTSTPASSCKARQADQDSFKIGPSGLTSEELDNFLKNHPDEFFQDKLRCPMKSILLFYINSGYFRFQEYKDYQSKLDEKEVDVRAINNELIDEMLTDAELTNIVREFYDVHSYTKPNLFSCGACGTRQFSRSRNPTVEYKKVRLNKSLIQPLAYTCSETIALQQEIDDPASYIDIPIDEDWNLKKVAVWKLRSVFLQETSATKKVFWHLHPELVENIDGGQPCTRLCPTCYTSLNKGKRPALSIAAGIDFGNPHRIGLEPVNFHEVLMLSKQRLFFGILKASSNRTGQCNFDIKNIMKCHAVLFPHDAPDVAAALFHIGLFEPGGFLDIETLKQYMLLYMMDETGKTDALAQAVYSSPTLLGRHWVMAQRLLVQRRANHEYGLLDLGPMDEFKYHIQRVIGELKQHIVDNCMTIDDPDAIAFERDLGADVAKVHNDEVITHEEFTARTAQAGLAEEQDSTQGSQPVTLQYSFITNTEESYLNQDSNDFRLKALHHFANLPNDDHNTTQVQADSSSDDSSRGDTPNPFQFDPGAIADYLRKHPPSNIHGTHREGQPLSDFDQSESGFVTSFPHVFLFGKGYGRLPANLSKQQIHHLLHQFTLVPSQDRTLLGYLFDVRQRANVIRGVNTYVEGNQTALKELARLLEDPEERKRLKEAIKTPHMSTSKAVLKKYLVHLRFAGKDVPYGAMQGTRFKHRAFGLCRRFGPSTTFLTLSPSNQDNARAVRMALRTVSNTEFPAVFEEGCPYGESGEEFLQHLLDKSNVVAEGDIRIPKSERARLAMTNPVAYVQENKDLLHDIMNILLGLTLEDQHSYTTNDTTSTRSTAYYKRRKGLFGHPLYGIGVTEDHARGTLHYHITFSAGISPYALQKFANVKQLCETISTVLDTMYSSEIDMHVHAGVIVRQYIRSHQAAWMLEPHIADSIRPIEPSLTRPHPVEMVSQGNGSITFPAICRAVQSQAGSQNWHTHGRTCVKGVQGKTGCRLSMPVALIQHTEPVNLTPYVNQDLGAFCTPCHGDDTLPQEANNLPQEASTLEERIYRSYTAVSKTGNRRQSFYTVKSPHHSSSPHSQSTTTHTLTDVLDPTLDKSVIVWETKRPIIALPPIPEDDIVDPKLSQIQWLESMLSNLPEFADPTSAFWKWLKEKASTDQVLAIFQHVHQTLPTANGHVAAFNSVLSFCTASHVNASLLGSLVQARGAMMYLVPYEAKSKFPMQHVLSVMDHTLNHIDKYPSVADDSGTQQRSVKHLLMRSLNRMHLQMEISDYEVAAALLNLPSLLITEKFQYGNPRALLNWISHMNDPSDESIEEGDDEESDDASSSTDNSTYDQHHAHQLSLSEKLQSRDKTKTKHGYRRESWISDSEDTDDSNDSVSSTSQVDSTSEHPTGPNYTKQPQLGQQQSRPPPEQTHAGLGFIRKIFLHTEKADTRDEPPSILLPDAALYYYRNDELRNMSYYEFLATTMFVNKAITNKQEDEQYREESKSTRAAKRFPLHPAFIGHTNCYHVLRRKQCTPLIVGSPPRHPGSKPRDTTKRLYQTWKKRADAYASYYLALFRPHSWDEALPDDWNALAGWITQLESSNNIADTFRLMAMNYHMKGVSTSNDVRQMTSNYRSRNRKIWSDKERKQNAWYMTEDDWKNKIAENADSFCDNTVFDSNETKRLEKVLMYDDLQAKELQRSLRPAHVHEELFQHQDVQGAHVSFDFISVHDIDDIHDILAQIKEWNPTAEESQIDHSSSTTRPNYTFAQKKQMVEDIRQGLSERSSGCNTQQLQLFDLYANYFLGTSHLKPPQIVLLHGGPGMGKSKLRQAIFAAAEICGRYIFKMAFNAINAVEMGGRTSSSATNLRSHHAHSTGTVHPDAIQRLLSNGFTIDSITCIEEVSTQAPFHLARADKFVATAMNSASCQQHLPLSINPSATAQHFGGGLVILIGDLSQLEPVKAGPSLTQAVMDIHADDIAYSVRRSKRQRGEKSKKKKKPQKETVLPSDDLDQNRFNHNHPYRIGADIITNVRLYELTQQQRSIDPAHTAFVRSTYKGESISLEQLKQYKILSQADFLGDEAEEWMRAPVLVATNRERFTITHIRAQSFAAYKNEVVVRWLTNFNRNSWQNRPTGDSFRDALDNDPCFYEYFVKGADGFITENIKTELGIVNAQSITYHSLKFDYEDQIFLNQVTLTTPPGGIITMPVRPVAVNVAIDMPEHTSPQAMESLRNMSIEPMDPAFPNRVVIPIGPHSTRQDPSYTIVRGGDNYAPSRVFLRKYIPLEPAFAITVHKSEGRTMSRVIIALSETPRIPQCNFKYAQLHVGLSRVQLGQHIRLLLTGNSDVERWRSIAYIQNLQPDPSIEFYFAGFRHLPADPSVDPNQNWMTNQWNAGRANFFFKRQRGLLH